MALELNNNSNSIVYNNKLIPSGLFSILLRCEIGSPIFTANSGTYSILKLSSASESLEFGIKYDKVNSIRSVVLRYASPWQTFTLEINNNLFTIGNCIFIEKISSSTIRLWTDAPTITNRTSSLNVNAFSTLDKVTIQGVSAFSFTVYDFTIWNTNIFNNTVITDLITTAIPFYYPTTGAISFYHNFITTPNNPYVFSPVVPVYNNIQFGTLTLGRNPYPSGFSYNYSNHRPILPPEPTTYTFDLLSSLNFSSNSTSTNEQSPINVLQNIVRIAHTFYTSSTVLNRTWEDFISFVQNIETTKVKTARQYVFMVEEWLIEREILEPGSTEEIIRIVEEIVRNVDVSKSINNQLTFSNVTHLIKQSPAQNFGE